MSGVKCVFMRLSVHLKKYFRVWKKAVIVTQNWVLKWKSMGIFSKNGIIKSDGAARSIRQSGMEERVAMANQKTAKKPSRKVFDVVSDNHRPDQLFFASQALQTAYVRLKTRLSEVGAKFDPEMYVAGVTIALTYVQRESGIFSDFAIFMLACFGDSIKPHLLSFYAGICNAPEVVASDLTSYEECQKEYAALMQISI